VARSSAWLSWCLRPLGHQCPGLARVVVLVLLVLPSVEDRRPPLQSRTPGSGVLLLNAPLVSNQIRGTYLLEISISLRGQVSCSRKRRRGRFLVSNRLPTCLEQLVGLQFFDTSLVISVSSAPGRYSWLRIEAVDRMDQLKVSVMVPGAAGSFVHDKQ
jgi:hypothetical protein